MNKKIMKQFFPVEIARVEKNLCPLCGNEINKKEFRNEISKQEFKISGMCQKCQDIIFNED